MRSVTLNRRVLVVDDDRAIHEVFRRLLGQGDASAAPGGLPSFALSFAAQGAEGLEMIAQGVAAGAPFALVILDVRMPPGWDGLDTLERIWAVDPHVQAVICTAYSDHTWEDLHRRLGATDRVLVLKKPFDPLEVLQIALAMTEKWNERVERRRSDAQTLGILQALPDAVCLLNEYGVVLRAHVPRGSRLRLRDGSWFAEALPDDDARQSVTDLLRRVLSIGTAERTEIDLGGDGPPALFETRWGRVDNAHAVVVLRPLSNGAADDEDPASMDDESFDESRSTLTDLPMPVVPVGDGVIVVPLVGDYDASKMRLLPGALASAVLAREARVVVLDGSCLSAPEVDLAASLDKVVRAIESVGADAVLAAMPVLLPGRGSMPPTFATIDEGIFEALARMADHEEVTSQS